MYKVLSTTQYKPNFSETNRATKLYVVITLSSEGTRPCI